QRERGQAGRRGPQQILIARILVGVGQRLAQKLLVRAAVDAEQADGRRDRRLAGGGRGFLQFGERRQPATVADLADRDRRILLQRAIELRHGVDRAERVARFVVTQCFDGGAPKEILSARYFLDERLLNARIRPERGERAHELGPHEFGGLLV